MADNPAHPEYACAIARRQTFKEWPPSNVKPTVESLVAAGFFYDACGGGGDKTKCYWCGGGLHDWLATDNPQEEHAFYFKQCLLSVNKKL